MKKIGIAAFFMICMFSGHVNADSKVESVYGNNRVDTSIEISKKTFNESENVILVSGKNYADSISSIMLSSRYRCPIILTDGNNLEDNVMKEIKRLGAKEIYIVGGLSSVPQESADKIKSSGIEIHRISGKNRYETNQKVVDYFKSDNSEAVFVSGDKFADAISIGSYAYTKSIPIVLLPQNPDDNVKNYLSNIDFERKLIIGGDSSISKTYEDVLKTNERIFGKTRYETSFKINKMFFQNTDKLFLTTGETFSDALSGVPYAAENKSNLVLYNQNPLLYFNKEKYSELKIIGGMLKSKLDTEYVGNEVYNKNYMESANNIVNNSIPTINDNNSFISYYGDFNKYLKESRSTQRRIYGFFFLNDLINAYKETGDTKYFTVGMDMIKRFESEIELDDKKDTMIWHDETVARRLDNYLNFYVNFNLYMNYNEKTIMRNSMYKIAKLISDTSFWSGSNNHGMFQDIACMKYARFFGYNEMYTKSFNRAAKYLLSSYDEEGVHRENSPEYQFVILKEMRNILNMTKNKDTELYNRLKDRYNKTLNFSKAILLPDGNIPNIGDSKTMKIDLDDYYSGYNRSYYGDELERYTFSNSGYDIVKNASSYMLLRGGYLDDYHHQNDDLTLWIYKNGNIFTESGAYGYEYTNPYANYSKDFEAHNTLIVDGFNSVSGKEVHIKSPSDSNIMHGYTKRIEGVEFNRNVEYNNDFTKIIIDDNITSTNNISHNYELLFHLDPSITPVKNGREIELYRSGEKIGTFVTDEETEIKDDVYFPDYSRGIMKTKTIRVIFKGSNYRVKSEINLY